VPGPLMKAAFGAVSDDVLEVTQESSPDSDVVVQRRERRRGDAVEGLGQATVGVPVAKTQVTSPRSVAPSCTCRVTVTFAPQATLPTTKSKLRHTAAPPAVSTP